MAGFLTDHVNNKVLDCFFGGSPIAPAPTLHVGLSALKSNRAGKVAEPTGGSYGRVVLPNDRAQFPDASFGAKSNAGAITFPSPSADWGPIRCVFLADAPADGNVLAMADLPGPRVIHGGDPAPTIAAHALSLLQT